MFPTSPASPQYHDDASSDFPITKGNGEIRADSDKLAPADAASLSSSRAVSASDAHRSKVNGAVGLQDALEEAHAKIKALSKELDDQKSISGVSSESSKSATSSNAAVAVTRSQSGLPIPHAVVLVLIAFFLGWFFF